ncbi:hypothetical protein JW992_14610 [candidate division KSB1 bacterium]|nr:hypothetical protein [candidate division KSB1 bacterium]
MARWLFTLFIFSLLGTVAGLFFLYKAWQYRKNAHLAWAATSDWAMQPLVSRNSPADSGGIVLLGASITRDWPTSDWMRSLHIVNKGQYGQVSGQYLLRFKQDVIDLKPKAVVIKLCAIHATRGIPPEVTLGNLEMMIQLARYNQIEPFVASTIPVSRTFQPGNSRSLAQKILLLNQGIKSCCNRHQVTLIDYASALADEGGYLKSEYTTDGMHLNEQGYALMQEILLKEIKDGKESRP